MNRKVAPKYTDIENIRFIEPELLKFDNGLEMAIFKTGSQEIVKLEFVFEAGIMFQDKALVASTCNAMLQEGSQLFTAEQIAESLDFNGSHLSLTIDKDFSKVTLVSLEKNIEEGVKILKDIILDPLFPEDKLDKFLSKKLQSFKLESKKVKELSTRKFTREVFGTEHPYGAVAQELDFGNVTREDLIKYHEKCYSPANCKMIVAGQFSESTIDLISENFSAWNKETLIKEPILFNASKIEEKEFLIVKDDAMQSAVRLGKILFNKNHEDYSRMQVVNTILGGYFGSRLMKNIREDKGYTYGIGSALISLKETGYFTIMTEVNAEFSKETVEQVRKEIKILRTDLIGEEELDKVKSYLLGRLLRAVDGPLSLSESYLNVWAYGLDWKYYQEYIKVIKKISPQEVQDLTNKYLHEDSLIQVIAGK